MQLAIPAKAGTQEESVSHEGTKARSSVHILRAFVPSCEKSWIAAFAGLAMLLLALIAGPASAQTFPPLTGRVVDQAKLLSPAQTVDLTSKLAALEAGTGRQLVVATVPSLQGRTIEDYGYRLGRTWAIGQKGKDDGVILLVAPNERKVRIETGYGARVFVTDAVSSVIIRDAITPKFKAGDMGGGIVAGTDQLVQFMSLPAAEMQKRAAAAAQQQRRGSNGSPGFVPIIFWIIIILFVIMPIVRRASGRRYSGQRGGGPVILWGPGIGGGSGSSWGGGGGGWGGGGGGFSGGGGSFGGGGSSGGW